MATITNLRNPTLKPRHWEEVETILEAKFTPEQPLTLGRLIDIDAFDHAEELEEIAGKASSEFGLEIILKKVKYTTFHLCREFIVIVAISLFIFLLCS